MKDKITKISDKKQRAKLVFALRQTIGQTVLAGGTIAYIASNLDKLTRNYAFGIGVAIVLLVLYFTNKR